MLIPLFLSLFALIALPAKTALAFPGIPDGYPTPVPIPYAQSDWANTNFSESCPECGPIGSDVKEISWYQINPGPDSYNWNPVEDYLDAASKQKVFLRSGEVISKPVTMCIGVYSTGDPPAGSEWDMFKDLTPNWVYGSSKHGHIVEDKQCGKKAIVPRYDDASWRQAYFKMVEAFGKKFGNDPRLSAVEICSGIDGELIDVKNWGGCNFRGQINFGGHWQEYVYKSAETYRKAFPNKPVYQQGTFDGYGITGQSGYKGILEYAPPVGYKINAMKPDLNNHWVWVKNGEKALQGINSLMQTLYGQAPTAMESGPAFWQNGEYFGFLMGLSNHLGWTDTYSSWLNNKIVTSGFAADHLGKTIKNTPDVWIVLRDTNYRLADNPQTWAASGKYGDYEYWLYRPENVRANMNNYPNYKGGNTINENIVGNKTVIVDKEDLPGAECDLDARPPESWKARRTDQANNQNYMSFKVDDNYPPKKEGQVGYRIIVTYVDQNQNPNGGPDKFLIQYKKKGDDKIYSSAPIVKNKRQKSNSLCHNQDKPIPSGEADYTDWWQSREFVLPQAYFNNQMPGETDFRIYNNKDGDEIIHMVRVTAGIDARPEVINFTCGDSGNCTPSSISIDIDAISSQSKLSWQAVSETPWLKINKKSGQTPNRLDISIKPTSYPGGFHQAYVGIHNGKIYRPITVRVNAPPHLVVPTDYQCLKNSSGDFNCDLKIDETDLNTLLKEWAPSGPAPASKPNRSSPDLNGDNKINKDDLDILVENWRT